MLSSPVSSKALTRIVKLSDSAKSTRFLASKAATFPWWLFSIDSKFKGDWAASLGDNKTWGFSAANLPWILSTSSVGSLIRKMASIEFKIQIPKNNLINMSFHCRFLWPCFLAETSLSEKIWLFPLFSTIPLRCFATITKAAMLPDLEHNNFILIFTSKRTFIYKHKFNICYWIVLPSVNEFINVRKKLFLI